MLKQKLSQVVSRIEHEVALSAFVARVFMSSVAQDARAAVRKRVQHTSIYYVYGWCRALSGV